MEDDWSCRTGTASPLNWGNKTVYCMDIVTHIFPFDAWLCGLPSFRRGCILSSPSRHTLEGILISNFLSVFSASTSERYYFSASFVHGTWCAFGMFYVSVFRCSAVSHLTSLLLVFLLTFSWLSFVCLRTRRAYEHIFPGQARRIALEKNSPPPITMDLKWLSSNRAQD